jgi:Ca2+-binding EF-hand superfamily protein
MPSAAMGPNPTQNDSSSSPQDAVIASSNASGTANRNASERNTSNISKKVAGNISTLASTELTASIKANAVEIPIKSAFGFDIGDTVQIGRETRKIVGFGSLILDTPLQQAYAAGTVVKVVTKATVTLAPGWWAAEANHTAVPQDVLDHKAKDSLTERAISAAEPSFGDLDCVDRDNFVTLDEAATFGVKNGIPWSEVKPIFDICDENHDNRLSRDEFEKAHPVGTAVLKDFRANFHDIDIDGDNLISYREWMVYCDGWMAPRPSSEKCQELFNKADVENPKGSVDHSEFDNGGPRKASGNGSGFLLAIAAKGGQMTGNVGSWRTLTSTNVAAGQMLGALCRRHRRDIPNVASAIFKS